LYFSKAEGASLAAAPGKHGGKIVKKSGVECVLLPQTGKHPVVPQKELTSLRFSPHVGRAEHCSSRGNENQMLSERSAVQVLARSKFIWLPPDARSAGISGIRGDFFWFFFVKENEHFFK